MTAYCKCGAWCMHLQEGGCSGDVIAIDDAPCPKHRCYAHAAKYGFTMAITVAGEGTSTALERSSLGPGATRSDTMLATAVTDLVAIANELDDTYSHECNGASCPCCKPGIKASRIQQIASRLAELVRP